MTSHSSLNSRIVRCEFARPSQIPGAPSAPSGKKSLAFSLAFQAADRTLTDAEVEAEKRRILEAVSRELGALLRG